jgi:hypothetical protein
LAEIKHFPHEVYVVTCVMWIEVICVVMLSGRVIYSRCFESGTFLQNIKKLMTFLPTALLLCTRLTGV